MNFSDCIKEYQTNLTPEFCQAVIDRFNSDERTIRGETGMGHNHEIKMSQDLLISDLDDWKTEDDAFFAAITDYIQEYHVFMNSVSNSYLLTEPISDMGYQIQKTVPGEFYHWHQDGCQSYFNNMELVNSAGSQQMHIRHRIYTYILYLNDRTGIEDGRTQFMFGDEIVSIEAKPGKLLMFPANEMYTHRGETLLTGEKYLMTGWIVVPSTASMAFPSPDDRRNWERMLQDDGVTAVDRTNT